MRRSRTSRAPASASKRQRAVLLHDGNGKRPIGRADRERGGRPRRIQLDPLPSLGLATQTRRRACGPSPNPSTTRAACPRFPRICHERRTVEPLGGLDECGRRLLGGAEPPLLEPSAPPGLPLPDRTPPAPVRARIPCRMHSAPAAPPDAPMPLACDLRRPSAAAPREPAAAPRTHARRTAGAARARARAIVPTSTTAERAVAPGPATPERCSGCRSGPRHRACCRPHPPTGCSHRAPRCP